MDFKDELHTFITNWATKGLLFYIYLGAATIKRTSE